MYFADAYPELTEDQRRSFAAAERRLLVRLVVIGCCGLTMLGMVLA